MTPAHNLIEGYFINARVMLGPGPFVTYPGGVVHGPHGSKSGGKILTLKRTLVDPANQALLNATRPVG